VLLTLFFHPAKGKKGKPNGISPELEEQWQRDRAKKAEFKRLRADARGEAASLGIQWKKHRILHGSAPDLLQPANDLDSVERLIRSFLKNLGGPGSLSLPAMSREARKKVHDLAGAFNLKSKSKGKGTSRYTTLIKTACGTYHEWRWWSRLEADWKGKWWQCREAAGRRYRWEFGCKDRREQYGIHSSPTNGVGAFISVSFTSNDSPLNRWSEGDRIGKTGGLEVPLTAVIKNTKLGLGATK
jgi:hypothetical protein